MREIFLSERIFTKDNQESFATLSGDWNPLHLDEEVARRSLTGTIIAHGMHGVLWALNSVIKLNYINNNIESIQVRFHMPIKLNEKTQCYFIEDDIKKKYKIVIKSNEVLKTTILISSSKFKHSNVISNGKYEKLSPKIYNFDKNTTKQFIKELKLDKILYESMFSYLNKKFSDIQINVLLGISNIIGMECPGYYSLFSGFNVIWNACSENLIKYQIDDYNERFSSVKIKIKSGDTIGQLQSFIRPPSVEQKLSHKVKKSIPNKIFSDWKVLIIGGSRGLGESSARLLAQGGAKLCLTYCKGLNDAKKISRETSSQIIHLDIFSDYAINIDWQPTHLLYFPTPNIVNEDKNVNSKYLIEIYEKYFIEGFEKIIKKIYSGKMLKVFYPSTVYIDDNLNKQYRNYAEVKKLKYYFDR
tara:strand:- start:25 stop:1269 length:1245 start_codon:yes stop_codon:yes gene_type:complete